MLFRPEDAASLVYMLVGNSFGKYGGRESREQLEIVLSRMVLGG